MTALARVASWLGENEATISAVVGIAVLAGIVFAGVRSLLSRADRGFERGFASDKRRSVKSRGEEGRSVVLDPPLAGTPRREALASSVLFSWCSFPPSLHGLIIVPAATARRPGIELRVTKGTCL